MSIDCHDCWECAVWDPEDREHDVEAPCPALNLRTKAVGGGCATHFIPVEIVESPKKESAS